MSNSKTAMFIEREIQKIMDKLQNGELDDEGRLVTEENPVERDFLDEVLQDLTPQQRAKLAQHLQDERTAETQSALRFEYETKLRELAQKMRQSPFFKNECEKLRNQFRKRGLYV